MLVWPWIFFGVLWARKGIQMNNRLAKFVTAHPQITNFFVTFIGTLVRLVVGYLFSEAIIRISQELMAEDHLNPFRLSVIAGFKSQGLPWGLGDMKYLFGHRRRLLRAALVAICWGTFTLVPSSTTSLLGPAPFDKTAPLSGTELDFSSGAADCIAWLNNHAIPNVCDWENYRGMSYTTCLGQNQMVDVLESGRSNILSLITSNSQTFDFNQLGAKNGLKFLGPIGGVLPIGPNGVPAFDTLADSPLSNPETVAGILSYNYTLENQGLTSKVSCQYTSQSPINLFPVPEDTTRRLLLQYNGTCNRPGETDVLTNVHQFMGLNANSTLTFWACKSPPTETEPSYFIYLRGSGFYKTAIGNIACTISPIQPAIFPVTYQSIPGIFSSEKPRLVHATTFSGYIDSSVIGLGGLVEEAQNQQANLIAESVITFGIKSFGLPEKQQHPQYLRLYEAMIQGIMQYLATYSRLLISTEGNRPSSCTRVVTGNLSYRVLGWSVTADNIGLLIPMTVVNLAALAIMVLVILWTKPGSFESDPTDPKNLIVAEHHLEDGTGWKDRVTYRDRVSDSKS